MTKRWLAGLAGITFGVLLLVFGRWSSDSTPVASDKTTLVVYCAHDAEYAEPLFQEFTRKTGIPVAPIFDTEATKSFGIVNKLLAERQVARCDVFWNNEPLGTMRLAAENLLIPYKGSGWERIPPRFRDPEGKWVGFAARMRVHILPEREQGYTEKEIGTLWAGPLSLLVQAKPLYGTTLVHYTLLAREWGLVRLQHWHQKNRERGLREVNGNGPAKNLVVEGVCLAGWTDTDDYCSAKLNGAKVVAYPIRLDDGKTICLPNTVCIVEGTNHQEEARLLVDFLLSEEAERRLANSPARQIPLGPTPLEGLPPEIGEFRQWAEQGTSLANLVDLREKCVMWLTQEYLR